MGKWIAGILATILGGSLMWFLTNGVFPHWLRKDQTPAPKAVTVACTPTPPSIQPGGTSEVLVTVTRGGQPLEGATVSLDIGGGHFSGGTTTATGTTYSGGMFRVAWTAPNPSAASYVFPADVSLDGLRTAEGELSGHYRTTCEILVHS